MPSKNHDACFLIGKLEIGEMKYVQTNSNIA